MNAQDLQGLDPPIISPFNEQLGIRFIRVGGDEVELHLPVRPELLNSAGIVHGGVFASFADTALSAAIYSHVAMEKMVITLELSCRYLQPAREGVLQAFARALRVGGRTAVAEAEIRLGGELLVKASGTFTLMPRTTISTGREGT
jgi:uncharacterized protein (TIGR00369 family)